MTAVASAPSLATADLLGVFHEVPLLSPAQCTYLIDAGERHALSIGGWPLVGPYDGAQQLTLRLDAIPVLDPWLERQTEAVMRVVRHLFGLPDAVQLALQYRVVKYVAGGAGEAVALHSDGSPVSLVCALNGDFEGGGTYVRVLDRVLAPPLGRALVFSGRWLHSGLPVTRGTRYIMTVFVEWAGEGAARAAALQRILRVEERASVAPRRCRGGWSLARAFEPRPHCDACQARSEEPRIVHRCLAAGCCAVTACSACIGGYPASEPTLDPPPVHPEAPPWTVQLQPLPWPEGPLEVCLGCGESGSSALRRHGLPCAVPREGHEHPDLTAEFVSDETVPDGSAVEAGAVLLKVWRLRPQAPWPEGGRGLTLVRDDVDSEDPAAPDRHVGSRAGPEPVRTRPDGDGEARVEVVAPGRPGQYRVYFRLVHAATGAPFGDRLWVDFVVGDVQALAGPTWYE